MDGKRPVRNDAKAFRQTDPLSGSSLDREIAAALNVDPSPEFLPRVRMRVASEPAPAPWRLRWLVLAGAAAAVVLMAVVVTLWPAADRDEPQQAALPEAAPLAEPQAAPAPSPAAPVEHPARTPRSVEARAQLARLEGTPTGVPVDREGTPTGVPVDTPPDLPPFPEVLISADEVRAYRMLLGIVDQQRLRPSPPSQPARAETGAVDLKDIDLASLKIEALPPMARLEGVRP
jgi:hypothetical protein